MAKECSHFLEQVEHGCYLAQATLSTLQMYEERLGDEFSTRHFQALKSKACSLRSGSCGAMSAWNAAWVRCQEVRQRLEKMQKKKACKDKKRNQQTTAVSTHGEDGGMEKRTEMREVEWSLTQQTIPQKDVAYIRESEHTTAAFLKGNEPQNGHSHLDTKWKPRGHHSEADLRRTASVQEDADISWHRILGRSLSEGSRITTFTPFAIDDSLFNVKEPVYQRNKVPQKSEPLQNPPSSPFESLSVKSKDGNAEGPTKEDTASTQSSDETNESFFTPTENNGNNVL